MKRSIIIAVLLFMACATTGIQKKEDEAPLRIKINAPKEEVYQITASKLMEYGFTIESSDPALGMISTNYADINPSAMAGAFLEAFAGQKNLKAKISTQIINDSLGAELIMRGLGQYAQDKGLFRQDEINSQPVRKESYTYKRMEEIARAIKEAAEK